jgi:hypothetical protein
MSNINSFIIRSVDGSIDHEASIGAFAGALLKYEAERETEMEVIAEAVHALFDQYKGARLNTPFLVGETLRRLNAQPENYKVLTEKVQRFIRSQSQGETADDGTVERPNSVLIIGKGKGGGVARRADLPKK